jgi:yeast amino acid transporter
VAQIFVAIAPPGQSGTGDAEVFFKACLALPVVLFFWACGYLWKRQGFLKIEQIDIDTGRREHDWEVINAYRAEYKTWPLWKRILRTTF